MTNPLEFKIDLLSAITIIVTIISIILSINLSPIYIVTSISILVLMFFAFIVLSFWVIQNRQALEIKKLNEKLNIHQELIDLKAKVTYLIDKMGKRGQMHPIELMIRLMQIIAIIISVFIILKALQVI